MLNWSIRSDVCIMKKEEIEETILILFEIMKELDNKLKVLYIIVFVVFLVLGILVVSG